MVNAKLLNEIADIIEQNPSHWSQESWGYGNAEPVDIVVNGQHKVVECGTTHCVAGWAAALSGYKPFPTADGPDWNEVALDGIEYHDVAGIARALLGLEHSDLFYTGMDGEIEP